MNPQIKQKLQNYHPTDDAIRLIKDTPILLLVGPSGAGKDSLKMRLLQTGRYHHIVSHTTRPPRINRGVPEQEGVEYHFIDMPTAEKMLDEHAFIEAKVYSNNLYGTSIAEIQTAHDNHKIAVTDLEVQGVAEYKQYDENVVALFLLPPNFQTWQARLNRRYGDVVDVADARRRLETALQEIDQLLNYPYYIPMINDDVEVVFAQVEQLMQQGKRDAEAEQTALKTAMQLTQDIMEHLKTTEGLTG